MRFVKVYHSEEPDFVIGVPDAVLDTERFLDNVLHGASGWGDAQDTPEEALGDEPVKRWINDGSGYIICPECGEEHAWVGYRASYCDTCGARLLPEEGYDGD